MYILYGGPMTRSALVEQVMAECGVEYELRKIDTTKREQTSPEFLKINPAGWVPALLTPDGKTLYETPAINLYLAEKYCTPDLVPASGDPDRGLFLSGLFYITGMLEPALKRYWFPDRYADGVNDAEAVKARALEDAASYLKVINQRLSKWGPFHLGERFSLVDLTLAYWSESFYDTDVLEGLDAVRACHEKVYDRPKLRTHKFVQQRMLEDLDARRDSGDTSL